MSEAKRYSLIKPTLQTPFHIDYNWWIRHDTSWSVHLRNCLCDDHQKKYAELTGDSAWIDWVDPNTAEVRKIDGLQHILMTHCSKEPGFLTQNTTLVDAVFRVFIANGNSPLTPEALSELINKPARTIMRTLTGTKVYKGLRPIQQP